MMEKLYENENKFVDQEIDELDLLIENKELIDVVAKQNQLIKNENY